MAPIIWTSRNQRPVCLRRQNILLETRTDLEPGTDRPGVLNCRLCPYQYHHNSFPRGPEFQQLSDIHDVHVCSCCHRAPNNPGQVEILITPGLVLILISCGHWTPEAVTPIRLQTRDRIIIIIIVVVVCREKERFCTMTVTVRQGVGALNARADYLVSREMILDLESWNNSDNVFLGAAPAD